LILMVILAVLALPFIFLTSLVDWSGPINASFTAGICQWARSLFAVAIPQELFFRGVFLNVIVRRTGREVLGLVFCSIIGGLSYWNAQYELLYQTGYYVYGVISGLAFGWGFLKTKKLMAGIFAHSVLDFFAHYYIPIVMNPPVHPAMLIDLH